MKTDATKVTKFFNDNQERRIKEAMAARKEAMAAIKKFGEGGVSEEPSSKLYNRATKKYTKAQEQYEKGNILRGNFNLKRGDKLSKKAEEE